MSMQRVDILRNNGLSDLDKASAITNYLRKLLTITKWIFKRALDITGIDKKRPGIAKRGLGEGQIDGLRRILCFCNMR